MDPAVVHQPPDDQGERYVDVPAAHVQAQQQIEDGQADEGADERDEVDVVGEEDRDDQDREEVVDDGERQQERTERGRQRGADDGEDGEREGDVSGCGDGPAVDGTVADHIRQRVDDRRHGHAAQCGDDRERGRLRVAQFTRDEFALELDSRDEEEDREQSVGRPVRHGQMEAERLRPEMEVADGRVARCEGVRPDEGGHGGDQEDDSADGLRTQGLGEVVALGERQASQEGAAGEGARVWAWPRGETSGSVRQRWHG